MGTETQAAEEEWGDGMSDRRKLGTIGRCKVCGKAVRLVARPINPADGGTEIWLHFGVGPNHYGKPMSGVVDGRCVDGEWVRDE